MATARHRKEAPGGYLFVITVALLLGLQACGGARRGEGTILVARGSPLLVEDGGERVLVALAPAASLMGLGHPRELRPGDHVRYRWRDAIASVRLAEELSADPVVGAEASYGYREDELAVAMEQGRAPRLLDARPAEAYAVGHLPGATSLPADARAAAIDAAIRGDPAAPIVIYAESARDDSAHRLARVLISAGAEDVRVLLGGVREWTEADRALELRASDAARAMAAAGPWTVVDTRASAGGGERPAGAVSMPPAAFRWTDFDGGLPLSHVLFVGEGPGDSAPAEMANRVRTLRSARAVKTTLRLYVLAGGFDEWKRAGQAVERGNDPRTELGYVPSVDAEIPPREFEALWGSQGGGGAVFLDVRRVGTSGEPWVVKIPLEDLPARLAELRRDREIVAFCAVGERSRVAAELLRANGFRARFLRAQSSH